MFFHQFTKNFILIPKKLPFKSCNLHSFQISLCHKGILGIFLAIGANITVNSMKPNI